MDPDDCFSSIPYEKVRKTKLGGGLEGCGCRGGARTERRPPARRRGRAAAAIAPVDSRKVLCLSFEAIGRAFEPGRAERAQLLKPSRGFLSRTRASLSHSVRTSYVVTSVWAAPESCLSFRLSRAGGRGGPAGGSPRRRSPSSPVPLALVRQLAADGVISHTHCRVSRSFTTCK